MSMYVSHVEIISKYSAMMEIFMNNKWKTSYPHLLKKVLCDSTNSLNLRQVVVGFTLVCDFQPSLIKFNI